MRYSYFFTIAAIALASCHEERRASTGVFGEPEDTITTGFDLDEVREAGELIVGTLSGPDTYFEYRGQGFGLQYQLALNYAQSIGTRLRVEVAHDTTELIDRLAQGEVDLVVMPFTPADLKRLRQEDDFSEDITCLDSSTQWLLPAASLQLQESITAWYSPSLLTRIAEGEKKMASASHTVRRRPRPMMLNAAKGQISQYDDLLQRHAASIGWDWRLLAAQCYQESAFDPRAVSWVGAQGLMQIMPGTAAQLGLAAADVFNPEKNIAAGTRYIGMLTKKFLDIPDARERISFVLAAYNGGTGHVRDAMALCRKHGGNPLLWRQVSPWILHLSEPRYYRDPVVQNGYMRGSETEGYVSSILSRWSQYCGQARSVSSGSTPAPARKARNNEESRIRSREEIMNGNVE